MTRRFPTVEALARALGTRPQPLPGEEQMQAAVAICLEQDAVLLVRRAEHEHDPWSGHVGLPGGRHEPEDASLLETALRETCEEVGFDPSRHGRVLGALGSYSGLGRRAPRVRIAVFVVALDERPLLTLSDEIAAAWWVRLDSLVPTRAHVAAAGMPMPAHLVAADGDEHLVWGITYRILELLREVE